MEILHTLMYNVLFFLGNAILREWYIICKLIKLKSSPKKQAPELLNK